MSEQFKAEERDIRSILSQNRKYVVPRNQRDYVWDKNNFEELFLDIVDSIEVDEKKDVHMSKYFLGSCVFIDKENISYEIIDGQQRITTLLILLAAIAHKFISLDQNGLAESTLRYIKKVDDYGEMYMVLKNDLLEPILDEYLCYGESKLVPRNQQQKKVIEAFNVFSDCLESSYICSIFKLDYLKCLTIIRDQVLNLKVVEIIADSEVDAYSVFEILNARGKALGIDDMIRNWCMKKSIPLAPADKAKNIWLEIKMNIEINNAETSMNQFVKHFLRAKFGQEYDDNKTYRIIKKEITSVNVFTFLEEMKECSSYYSMFKKPNRSELKPNEYKALEFFKNFRFTQVRPILLAIYHQNHLKKISDKDLYAILNYLISFHSKYSVICKKLPSAVERVYNEYSSKIYNTYNKKDLIDLKGELKKLEPNKEQFYESLSTIYWTNKKTNLKKNKQAVIHILTELERTNIKTDELLVGEFNIEHIQGDIGNEYTSSIGNLLPLDPTINNNAGNMCLKEKITRYERSSLNSVKNFLIHNGHFETWENSNILDRTKKIADRLYKETWKL